MPHAFIALGANIPSPAGPPDATLAAAVTRLAARGHITARSSVYSTEPVGLSDQPRFLNAVIALETELDPQHLLQALLCIEKEYGRDRASGIFKGPRTLDLDILLLGDLHLDEPGLTLPHPRLADRAFVLVPLNEIAPGLEIPGHEKSVSDLLEELQRKCLGESDAVLQVESDRWSQSAAEALGSLS